MTRKMLVVGAHAADFVWRAAGAIAVASSKGDDVLVIALSYGERGESGNLWQEPSQTIENVKQIRHKTAEQAARYLGAAFRCLDWGDYPLSVDDERLEQLVQIMRDVAPDVLLTHTPKDPFNPDHPVAYEVVQKARLLSAGAGVASAFKRIAPPVWYLFEPHQPELCDFKPDTFVDITAVIDQKIQAMQAISAQSYLKDYYTELAERRGNHARRISGKQNVKYAEAYQRMVPWVLDGL
ncbi:MAG: PIG-L deacetylase family protein [Candidatus Promineifilaceae bacterium]|nr:PIG-L deacetylase family protein [Candidatus Promineifilaceae bacterium]